MARARPSSKAALTKARKSPSMATRVLRDTLLRHWTMLRLIPRHPTKATAGAIADALSREGFEISKRSVERDLGLLSAAFPLLCDDRAKPYGWSWQRDAKPLQVPGMQAHEALIFKLAEAHLASLLPSALRASLLPYFKLADQRMREADSGRGPASWLAKVRVVSPTQPLLAPKVSEEIFRAITQSLLDGVRLEARYQRRGTNTVVAYELNPLGLVQRGAVSYLVASAWGYDEPLLFAMHRFTSATPLEELVRRVPGFDLDQYISGGAFGFAHSGQAIRLVARFDAPAAEHLLETPVSKDQALSAEGDIVTVTGTVADTAQLRWWLLGFGEQVEVLEPLTLRDEIRTTAKRMAARYRTA